MKIAIVLSLTLVAFVNASPGFTPLEIDNHPCTAERLKETVKYICDSNGNVICQHGWRDYKDPDKVDPMNRCAVPICDHKGETCKNGECRAPDFCACEVGWEGALCDQCIPLPGCIHGKCDKRPLECVCDEGWQGAYCDIPKCDGCVNGKCYQPNDCTCFEGWEGDKCDECIPLQGCVHGDCSFDLEYLPNTCECTTGNWTGHLCDEPVCDPACHKDHGKCVDGGASAHFCMCDMGYKGDTCSECMPYWECPNQGKDACKLPNECRCPADFSEPDDDDLCNNPALIKTS